MNQEIENDEEYKKALIKKYADAEFDNPLMITLPTIILSAGALAISLLSLSTKDLATDMKVFVLNLIVAVAIGLIVSALGFFIGQHFLKKRILKKLKCSNSNEIQARHCCSDTLGKVVDSVTKATNDNLDLEFKYNSSIECSGTLKQNEQNI